MVLSKTLAAAAHIHTPIANALQNYFGIRTNDGSRRGIGKDGPNDSGMIRAKYVLAQWIYLIGLDNEIW